MLADLVLNPLFREEDIEKEKGVILEEIKMDADSPDYLVHEIFSSNFWKDHPLGKPILGTRETVQALRPAAMLESYYKQVYAPANLLITAAGNLTHDGLVDLVRRAFRRAEAGGRAARESRPQHARAHRAAQQESRWNRCTCAWACRLIRCRTRSASPATC